MFDGATITNWSEHTYNAGDDTIESTSFVLSHDNDVYNVNVERLHDTIIVVCRHHDDGPHDDLGNDVDSGFWQDDEYSGSLHEFTTCVRCAYDDCNENRA